MSRESSSRPARAASLLLPAALLALAVAGCNDSGRGGPGAQPQAPNSAVTAAFQMSDAARCAEVFTSRETCMDFLAARESPPVDVFRDHYETRPVRRDDQLTVLRVIGRSDRGEWTFRLRRDEDAGWRITSFRARGAGA